MMLDSVAMFRRHSWDERLLDIKISHRSRPVATALHRDRRAANAAATEVARVLAVPRGSPGVWRGREVFGNRSEEIRLP
ncbi:hypothetical protein GCM10022242_19480 [Nocardioides panacisoli]|uniref:Uncharacterized protein n=1 Tax=Nocardioides panacisoli TaxID=627624 RepID=A0ABP7IG67_9ACTN